MLKKYKWLLCFLAVTIFMPSMPFGIVNNGTSQARAQNRSTFGGQRMAFAFAYGINPTVAPLQIFIGNTTTGSQTVQLNIGCDTAADGTIFCPLAIDAPIIVDTGAQQETVTPTAVSSLCGVPIPYNGCSFTATFAKTHGLGALITTGTVGLQEAINLTLTGTAGVPIVSGVAAGAGGQVSVDSTWTNYGGTTAMLTAAYLGGYLSGFGPNNGYPAVADVIDNRTNVVQWWDLKPSVTTTISAGSAVTLTQSAGGALTSTGSYRVSYWYIDVLGGISPAATDSAQIVLTGTNQTITTTAPAATAGAVAWIPLITASAGGNGTEIMVPVTSTICTVSTLETIIPACAIGATATIAANPSATAKEPTSGQTQAHTTFVPMPFYAPPALQIQTSYLPFSAVTTVATGTPADVAVLYLPAGVFNYLGKAFDICFNAASTDVSTAVPTWALTMANQYAQNAATVATIALPTATGALNTTGCFNIQTAVTGASGQFWGTGTLTQTQGTTTLSTATGVATAVAPSSNQPNLTQGIWVALNLTATTANITGVTVNQLTIRPVANN